MNARNTKTHALKLALALAVPLASTLLAEPVTAGDSVRLELLAEAGSSQAGSNQAKYGRGHSGHRHDVGHDRRRGHGHGRRGGHGHYDERHYDYGHGNFVRERAHRYARTAVGQAREARALGYYSDHPRWRMDYHRHFRWALQASPHRIDEEIRRRARKLRELRSWGQYGPGWGNHRHGPHCRH
ncbi:hypothetical protein [Halomonas denitrificans]|nr:hypothetical protein [Halomonas denitrificans]